MKIVISGGAGFIGSHFCELLLKEGHDVICIDNFVTGRRENIEHLLDIREFEVFNHDINKPWHTDNQIDFVVHLSAIASPLFYAKYPIETAKVGSLGTLNMLELAKKHEARFLLASSSEVYGNPLVTPQSETYFGNVNPFGWRSCYDESKRFSEALSWSYISQHHMDIRIARIFNTYGEKMRQDDGRVIPNFIVSALKNQNLTIYGDGKQTRSFCHVDDTVTALHKMIAVSDKQKSKPIPYPINIGNPEECTINELADIVLRITGSQSKVIHFDELVDDPKIRNPDISLAKKVLGWKPEISIENGLRRTIKYFESEMIQ